MHDTAIQPTSIGLDIFSDQFVEHLAHLVAFDRCWTAIVDSAANLPSNDDVSTCKLMRNEFLGEEYYNKSNAKDTSFIEHLFDLEFSFSKIIAAVNVFFPTPKIHAYHAEIMNDLVPGLAFYVRDGHLVYYSENAVRSVGHWVTKTNSNGRSFPVKEIFHKRCRKNRSSFTRI